MKVGAENKTKLWIMVGLALLAIALVVLRAIPFFSGPEPTLAAPNAKAAAQTSPVDPTLRTDLLKNSEEAEYKGSGRNIFEAHAAPPPLPRAIKPVVQPQAFGPPPPPPVAPPPPIPLKFYGFANRPGEPKSIFLAQGDDIFIGREGDIVNRRYKIIRIQQNQVEIEDVLNNNRQAIPLTQG